ncbi:ABC transporter permease [Variovorax ginsengisoli]|uniref:ABC transporter permease n=2 Tax=Variovorax guangxiensis TaxID=1775474 RepID=A0A502DHC9_9BURK|nr:ABC transporter permease [Variovorax guangxiensis]TPG24040.1 ABC transporter permease [Variovorax ginsengisoli]
MALGFNLPLVLMLGRSVMGEAGFTLTHFIEIVQVPAYLKVLLNTFRIALITAVCCMLLGYPLAYWLRRLPARWQLLALAAVVIPFWVSILVRTYAWIVVLGNAGIVNRTLTSLGWIDTPVAFLYNELGVVIGTINVLLPFLVLPLFAAMLKIDERLMRAAETLGASGWTAFWRVFFPLSLPALAAGAILVFILTLGFFITPAILGGGRVPMVANMLDLLVNHLPNWELASTISTVLLGVTLVLFAMYLRLTATRGQA